MESRRSAIVLPSPHPLDFDWRYDCATAEALVSLLGNLAPIVSIGAPTVARLLEANGGDVTLVDRQPIQAVRQHIVCDAASFRADRHYRAALVDPPWYPVQLARWTTTAATAVGPGGTVFVSVWPDATRPSAAAELTLALSRFSQWAQISRNTATLHYVTPLFETVARAHGGSTELSRSPLIGELVRLDVFAPPPVSPPSDLAVEWLRLTIDDYQLAIRLRPGDGPIRMEQVASADGWLWPYVSARAPGIDQIDIWSSVGEVATLGSSERMIDTLREALHGVDGKDFERALTDVPGLLAWRIPRPPYRRLIEWHHRQ
jgi:hypothetical protein